MGTATNLYTGTKIELPHITALPNGGFVVAYRFNTGAAGEIFQQVFGPAGALVSTGTTSADTLAGGDLDDNINISGSTTLAGGADRVLTGAGNDTVTIDGNNRTALVDTTATPANRSAASDGSTNCL